MTDRTGSRRERQRALAQARDGAQASARRRALIIIVAGLVLGGGLVALTSGYRGELTAWAERHPARALDLILPATAVTVLLPVLALAWYFWRLGVRIVREARFPPADVAWAGGAVVLHGVAAKRRGRVLQACSAALAVIVVTFGVLLVRLVWSLKTALDGRGAL
jgi:hypothetical protein